MGICSGTMKPLTTWVLLISIFHGTLGHFWSEDTERDEWIYYFQDSMFESSKFQGGMEPTKYDQLGYVGSAIIEVWIEQHCSVNSVRQGQTTKECYQCLENTGFTNVSASYICTQKYLPKEYMECWHKEHDNDTAKAEIDFMRCFRDTWLNFQFQDCIKKIRRNVPRGDKEIKRKGLCSQS